MDLVGEKRANRPDTTSPFLSPFNPRQSIFSFFFHRSNSCPTHGNLQNDPR